MNTSCETSLIQLGPRALWDSFATNGQTCLLLEDPGGQPLDRLLERALDLAKIMRIAISLSGALSKLHERGIIHRDIKPGNIIVDESSGAVWGDRDISADTAIRLGRYFGTDPRFWPNL
jgi:serine/threonine protein kinase